MEKTRVITVIGLLLLVLAFVLSACGGGNVAPISEGENAAEEQVQPQAQTGSAASDDDDEVQEPAAPAATLTPAEQFPETLVIHPEADNIQANPSSGTYVYIVPMMVQETTDYLLQEMEALGWQVLGKPTVMGHLATLNMTMDKTRVTISMQDNERSQTTRVQMVVLN